MVLNVIVLQVGFAFSATGETSAIVGALFRSSEGLQLLAMAVIMLYNGVFVMREIRAAESHLEAQLTATQTRKRYL